MKLDTCFVQIQYSESMKELENQFFKSLIEKIFTNQYYVTCFDLMESSDKYNVLKTFTPNNFFYSR